MAQQTQPQKPPPKKNQCIENIYQLSKSLNISDDIEANVPLEYNFHFINFSHHVHDEMYGTKEALK